MRRSSSWLGRVIAGAAVVALAALAGCGSSDAASPGEASGGLTPITIGVQPTAPFAVVPLGVQQGFFEKHGLKATVQVIGTASTIPPALLAGQIQFSNWSFASFTALADKKLPLKIVGPGDTAGSSLDNDYIQLVTLKSSGLTSTSQLSGKKVAVNSLASLSEAQMRVALQQAGVDPSSVEYIPIPFQDQFAALRANRVDAVGAAEPFLTTMKAGGEVQAIAALDAAIMPDMPLSLWMASQQYAAQNPQVVKQFQLALQESLEFAAKNTDAVRTFMPGFTGVDPAIAQKMILPTWVTSVEPAKLKKIAQTMHDQGVVGSVVDFDQYVLPFPPTAG